LNAGLVKVALDQIGSAVCIWKGCRQRAPFPNEQGGVFPLPHGWVCLLILDNEDRELRDSILCPAHSLKLSQLTKLPWA
jgi:hypothetical protein